MTTNAEKYKTAHERATEHEKFCLEQECSCCPCNVENQHDPEWRLCAFRWLELEACGEIAPCPFCGASCSVNAVCTDEHHGDGFYTVDCENEDCMYSSGAKDGYNVAIAAHNRVARAVTEAKEGGQR